MVSNLNNFQKRWTDFPRLVTWTVFMMNKNSKHERFPSLKHFLKKIEQINTLNISIKWMDFNYEWFPLWTFSRFEPKCDSWKRIPKNWIFSKKWMFFSILVTWTDFRSWTISVSKQILKWTHYLHLETFFKKIKKWTDFILNGFYLEFYLKKNIFS
jgi:hypothetical protein